MTDREFGRAWDKRLPRSDIRWLVGNCHVAWSEAAVEEHIRARIPDSWPLLVADEAVAYAIECHRANIDLFVAVQTGRFS